MGRVKIGVSGPLSETLGGSIAAAYSDHGPSFRNALPGAPHGNDLARTTARGQLVWSPNEQLELRLLAGYLHERDAQGESDVYFAPGAPSTTVAGLLQQPYSVAPCPENVPHDRTTCSIATNLLDLEAADLTVNLSYRLANDWTLSSVTGWDRYRDQRSEDDLAQLFTPLLFYHDSEQGTSVQQELRLASADAARLVWLAGLSYYTNEYRRGMGGERPMFGPNGSLAFIPLWQSLLDIPLALPGQLGIHDSGVDTDYYSAFGQVAWTFGAHLSVTGELRWQTEDKQASINNSVTLPGVSLISSLLTPSLSPSGEPVNGSVSRDTDYLTWSLTPQYRINDDLLTYLTVARGGKSAASTPDSATRRFLRASSATKPSTTSRSARGRPLPTDACAVESPRSTPNTTTIRMLRSFPASSWSATPTAWSSTARSSTARRISVPEPRSIWPCPSLISPMLQTRPAHVMRGAFQTAACPAHVP